MPSSDESRAGFDVFASWCTACRYEQLGLRNLVIYMDDKMQVPSTLGVVGIPGTLLIDREGREIGRKLGPAEWDSEAVVAEIQRYLK